MQYDIVHGKEMLKVTEVIVKPNHLLHLTFSTGERRVFDFKPLLKYPVFKPLENEALFRAARLDGVTVVWNDEIDIAPEDLYENGTADGSCSEIPNK